MSDIRTASLTELRVMADAGETRGAVSDAPERDMPEGFWREAVVESPKGTTRVSLDVETDVLDHFRRGGAGYRARMNAVLRAYVEERRSEAG